MPASRTPRHRADPRLPGAVIASLSESVRGGVRHARSLPRTSLVAAGAAVLALGLPTGASVAAMTGTLTPEQAGPFGPMVAALPVIDVLPAGPEAQGGTGGRDDDGRPAGQSLAAQAASPGAPEASGAAQGAAPSSGTGADDGSGAPVQVQPAEADAAPVLVEPAPEPAPVEAAEDVEAPATQEPAPETGPEVLSATAAAVVELTNAERAAAGCPALTVDSRLTAAAHLHSADMVAQDYFDHTSLDGRTPWDRAEAQGYTTPSGENIAAGQQDAAAVVQAWMDSPGHRENILNCDFVDIGIGEVDHVWTQMFGWG